MLREAPGMSFTMKRHSIFDNSLNPFFSYKNNTSEYDLRLKATQFLQKRIRF